MGSLIFSQPDGIHADENSGRRNPEDLILGKLNIVIRFHDSSKIDQLSHCLLALFGQAYDFIQPIIVLQGFSSEDQVLVQEEIAKWPWDLKHHSAFPIVLNCDNPRKQDLRSKLINIGIQAADGQYFSILDYDDVIYGDAYTYLISRLQKNEKCAISFGNIFRTDASPFNGFLYQEKKIAPFHGNDKLDLFVENFCPIHSFVIDRTRAPKEEMYFDEEMSKNEDYHFLVRLLTQSEGDFAARSKFVGEYYVRTDGSNTINSEYSDPSANKMHDWEKSFDRMAELFETRTTALSLSEIRFMRMKIRDLGASADNRVAAERIDSLQNQLDEKELLLQNSADLCALQEATIKTIFKPLIDAYSTDQSMTDGVAMLNIDSFSVAVDHVTIQGWCLNRKKHSSPLQAFIYSEGNLHSVKMNVPRKDVADHFGIASANGFNIAINRTSSGVRDQKFTFIAVFRNSEIFIKEIEK